MGAVSSLAGRRRAVWARLGRVGRKTGPKVPRDWHVEDFFETEKDEEHCVTSHYSNALDSSRRIPTEIQIGPSAFCLYRPSAVRDGLVFGKTGTVPCADWGLSLSVGAGLRDNETESAKKRAMFQAITVFRCLLLVCCSPVGSSGKRGSASPFSFSRGGCFFGRIASGGVW